MKSAYWMAANANRINRRNKSISTKVDNAKRFDPRELPIGGRFWYRSSGQIAEGEIAEHMPGEVCAWIIARYKNEEPRRTVLGYQFMNQMPMPDQHDQQV